MVEGVDFSTTSPGSAALKAAGKFFVVRYAADDWRGITTNEVRDYMTNGIDVAIVYEGRADRTLDGYAAGIYDATFAQNILLARGLPATMPIYFAVDFDEYPSQHPAIDQYLNGCADVLGKSRVGIYGGYDTMERCQQSGTATFYWQTLAWEYGRGLHPATHLYQYGFNDWINGTNCDDTKSLQENYGQARLYGNEPTTVPDSPVYTIPKLPGFYLKVNARVSPSAFDFNGYRYWPQRANVVALANTNVYSDVSNRSKLSAAPIKKGQKLSVEWILEDKNKHLWLVNKQGFMYGAKFSPQLFVPKARD